MLVVNAINFFFEELAWKWSLVPRGKKCFCSWGPTWSPWRHVQISITLSVSLVYYLQVYHFHFLQFISLIFLSCYYLSVLGLLFSIVYIYFLYNSKIFFRNFGQFYGEVGSISGVWSNLFSLSVICRGIFSITERVKLLDLEWLKVNLIWIINKQRADYPLQQQVAPKPVSGLTGWSTPVSFILESPYFFKKKHLTSTPSY